MKAKIKNDKARFGKPSKRSLFESTKKRDEGDRLKKDGANSQVDVACILSHDDHHLRGHSFTSILRK